MTKEYTVEYNIPDIIKMSEEIIKLSSMEQTPEIKKQILFNEKIRQSLYKNRLKYFEEWNKSNLEKTNTAKKLLASAIDRLGLGDNPSEAELADVTANLSKIDLTNIDMTSDFNMIAKNQLEGLALTQEISKLRQEITDLATESNDITLYYNLTLHEIHPIEEPVETQEQSITPFENITHVDVSPIETTSVDNATINVDLSNFNISKETIANHLAYDLGFTLSVDSETHDINLFNDKYPGSIFTIKDDSFDFTAPETLIDSEEYTKLRTDLFDYARENEIKRVNEEQIINNTSNIINIPGIANQSPIDILKDLIRESEIEELNNKEFTYTDLKGDKILSFKLDRNNENNESKIIIDRYGTKSDNEKLMFPITPEIIKKMNNNELSQDKSVKSSLDFVSKVTDSLEQQQGKKFGTLNLSLTENSKEVFNSKNIDKIIAKKENLLDEVKKSMTAAGFNLKQIEPIISEKQNEINDLKKVPNYTKSAWSNLFNDKRILSLSNGKPNFVGKSDVLLNLSFKNMFNPDNAEYTDLSNQTIVGNSFTIANYISNDYKNLLKTHNEHLKEAEKLMSRTDFDSVEKKNEFLGLAAADKVKMKVLFDNCMEKYNEYTICAFLAKQAFYKANIAFDNLKENIKTGIVNSNTYKTSLNNITKALKVCNDMTDKAFNALKDALQLGKDYLIQARDFSTNYIQTNINKAIEAKNLLVNNAVDSYIKTKDECIKEIDITKQQFNNHINVVKEDIEIAMAKIDIIKTEKALNKKAENSTKDYNQEKLANELFDNRIFEEVASKSDAEQLLSYSNLIFHEEVDNVIKTGKEAEKIPAERRTPLDNKKIEMGKEYAFKKELSQYIASNIKEKMMDVYKNPNLNYDKSVKAIAQVYKNLENNFYKDYAIRNGNGFDMEHDMQKDSFYVSMTDKLLVLNPKYENALKAKDSVMNKAPEKSANSHDSL